MQFSVLYLTRPLDHFWYDNDYRYHIKNGLALGKGPKIAHYQLFIKNRNQSQKRNENKRSGEDENKRNGGRVNKKRRVEKVEDVEKVEALMNDSSINSTKNPKNVGNAAQFPHPPLKHHLVV